MSVEFTWMDEAQTIAHRNFKKGWTWEDMNRAMETMDTILAKSDRRIDLIICYDHLNMVKTNPFNHIRNMAAARENTDPKIGSITVIGGGKVMEMVSDKLISLIPELGARMHFAESTDEALKIIQADRQDPYRAVI